MIKQIFLESPLGTIELSLSADCENKNVELLIETQKVFPLLPSGMEVDSCIAVKGKILNSGFSKAIRFEAKLNGGECLENNGPESGEALESQAWVNETDKVMIGTTDRDFLERIYKDHIKFNEHDDSVVYSENSMVIKIPQINNESVINLHFIIACATLPEINEDSCWYAVDIGQDFIDKHVKN